MEIVGAILEKSVIQILDRNLTKFDFPMIILNAVKSEIGFTNDFDKLSYLAI